MQPTLLLYALDLAGVAVFAVSGALAAGRKRLDLMGVFVIAAVTSIGGGTLRDVLLDRHPIFWIADPRYLGVILAAAVLTLVYARFRPPPHGALRLADALGLAAFTIAGTQVAEQQGLPAIAAVAMGAMTGVAGGAVRDVLTAEIPFVFRQGELYATAAIAGSVSYLALQAAGVPRAAAALAGVAVALALRIVAIRRGLQLPVFDLPDDASRPPPPR